MKSAFVLLCAACAFAQPQPTTGSVTLPVEEYNRLTDLASRQRKPDAIPVPHVLKSAAFNLRVNAQTIGGAVAIEGEIFASGDRKVPLLSGIAVLDAQQRARELPLHLEQGVHSALLTGPGEFALNLDVAVPLNIEPGRASFSLPVPAAGAARLTLTLPGEQTQVNLSPGLITSRTSQGGQTVIEATLSPGQNANLWWASRLSVPVPPAAPKESRFLSEVRTLVTVGEADVTLAALTQITVVQGEPSEFRLRVPADYELTGATGVTLSSTETQPGVVTLRVADASRRSHEFLVTFVKANSATKADLPLATFEGTQRETGEVLVESDGALDLNSNPSGSLRRMDMKEASPYLHALAHGTLQAAFRYQKRPSEVMTVNLDWVRYSDSRVLSAVAQRAEVTTLVTSEGRSLTEVKLTLRNQSQPFLKVALPTGASILSAEVAAERVKPLEGTDGSRVPLLRAGFRPAGPYVVSFVILHADAPFAKKGNGALALPRMDLPIGEMDWEVFLPQQYRVAKFGGDVAPADRFPTLAADAGYVIAETNTGMPGDLSGILVDPAGAVVPNAPVTIVQGNRTYHAMSDANGRWSIAGIPDGPVTVQIAVPGFRRWTRELQAANRGTSIRSMIEVGSASESVTVSEGSAILKSQSSVNQVRDLPLMAQTAPSMNVADLQKRVTGVLPLAINIPRSGNSYRFLRTLVVDEETKLSFAYRR